MPQAFHELLSPKTKLVGLVLVSNTLGCVAPAQAISEAAHKVCPHHLKSLLWSLRSLSHGQH